MQETAKSDVQLRQRLVDLHDDMNKYRYAYGWTWFGRPIIQIPQDTMLFQEMIWEIKPDLVVETGVAHGGSVIWAASMLALLETFNLVTNPLVIGIDIDIRDDNRHEIESHPAFRWIQLLEGSSTDSDVVARVRSIAKGKNRVMVFLDSHHEHDHVLGELRAFADLVTMGSVLVVLDTGIETISPDVIATGRPWGRGNSPLSALNEFLEESDNFIRDDSYQNKAWITSFPSGVIRRVQ
jgi:cephalosporin hydroxylase